MVSDSWSFSPLHRDGKPVSMENVNLGSHGGFLSHFDPQQVAVVFHNTKPRRGPAIEHQDHASRIASSAARPCSQPTTGGSGCILWTAAGESLVVS